MKKILAIATGLPAAMMSISLSLLIIIKSGRKCLTGWVFTALFIMLTWCLPAHAVQRSFLNNGFEDIWGPLVGANVNYCWIYDGSESPWLSNDNSAAGTGPCNGYNGGSYGSGTNIIEIWFNNFNGVPARAGKVHAELNANLASTLHQNVCVLQNEDITWRLSHRGRDGIDQMQYYVGNAATGMVLDASTGNNGATTINACQTGSSVTPVSGCTQNTVNTWGDYGGSFKWLGPSAVTSINFQAISTNGGAGSLTVGNFLDDVYFYLKPIVEFSASNSSGPESVATPSTPRLHVAGELTAPLNISISIIGGTALLGTDYTTPSGTANFTVTIPTGIYSETDLFDTGIQIINDRVADGDKTIIMQVNANSAYIISSSQTCGQIVNNIVTYTIIDDDATLRLNKTTIGGIGTFTYSLTNVDTDLSAAGNQTTASITTTAASTPVEFDANSGTAGTQPIVVATVGADVNITETVPGGWSVSGSCSVSGGSNPTSAPIAINTGGTVTIPAANVTAGSITTCSYSNTKSLSLTKSFNTGTIGVGQTARLTYTITNPAGSPAQTGLSFTDTFPGSLVVAATPNVVSSCGGTTPTPAGGATSFVVTGVNASPGTSTCTISVDVTSNSAGSYVNGSGQMTAISPQLTNGVTDQTLNVTQAGLTKSFFPTTINQGGTSTLTFTLANGTGNPAQAGINFTDTLPANVTVAASPNITTTCPSGTGIVTASGGSGTITVTGATMSSAQAFCTVTMDVTSSTLGGPYSNTSGSISGLARLSNNVAQSDLYVHGATLTKSFSTGSIGVGQTATLTFAIENPSGSGAKTGLSFTDALPGAGGITAAVTTPQCGGTVSVTGGNVINFSGGSISAGPSTCKITATVSGVTAGSYVNGSGQITAISGMTNSVTDQTLNVVPASLTKSYSPATVDQNATSTLTFTLTNGSGNPAQSNLTFTDSLVASGTALVVTAVTPLTGTGCSATTPTIGANPARVTLTNASMLAGATTCTFTATVRGDTIGAYNNLPANISGSSSRINYSGVNSTLTVVAARPTLTKAFTTPIAKGATSTLTFTINNIAGNPARSGINFTDTLPTNVTVAATPTIQSNCPAGGAFSNNPAFVTAAAGSGAITTTGAALNNTVASCQIRVNVTGSTEGTYVNDTTDFSGQANINTTATTATLNVYAPPAVTKSFGAANIASGGITTMTLTMTNPATNPGDLTTVQVIDNFLLSPGDIGLRVQNAAFTLGTNTGCTTSQIRDAGGGAFGVGDSGIRFRYTTVTPGASCSVTISVTSSTVGAVTNTTQLPTATGPMALTGTAASAPLSVGAPTLTKSLGTSPIAAGQPSVLTFTITNSTGNPTQSGLNFTDTLPGSVKVAGTPNIQSNCPAGGAFANNPAFVSAPAGSSAITTTGTAMNNTVASCQIRLNVTSDTAGSYINGPANSSISGVSANLINGVTDQTLVVRQPGLNKVFSPTTIDQGATSTLTFTITNDTGNLAQSGINFTDTLPANVIVAGTPNIQSNCPAGGAFANNPAFVTATAGSVTITTTGAAMNNTVASCQIRVDVTSNTAGGPYNNTSSSISGLAHLTNSVTSSGLTVRAYPVLAKAFSGTATINVGQTNTLTLTINNNVTNSVARTTLAFTDTLPGAGGITVTTTTPQCGGTVTVTGGNVISFSNGTVAAGGICTVTATVTGVTAGNYINGPTNSSISGLSTNLVSGVTDQTLVVNTVPSITVVKSVQTYSDPINNTTNPKAIPGAYMTYTIQVINSGLGTVDNDTTVITDLIPANTVMCVTQACNNANPPVTFSCSVAPACGLSFNAATDVSYSYQAGGGAPYVYPPTSPDGAGFDASVKEVRLNPKGIFNAASGGNNSTFSLLFKVMVK